MKTIFQIKETIMMCNTKTILKVGLGMFFGAVIAYLALPEFRGWILAASPTLLFLLCPISMLLCMKMMHGQNGQSCGKASADTKELPPSLTNGTNK